MCYKDIILVPLFDRAANVRAYALIDADDEDLIFEHDWHLNGDGHAARIGTGKQRGQSIYMHRVIMDVGYGDDIIVDHINRQKLDNRRSNLRLVTKAQNRQNLSPRPNASSKYRGVSFKKASPILTWQARVCVNKKLIDLGRYDTEEEAAQVAYEAREKYGIAHYTKRASASSKYQGVGLKRSGHSRDMWTARVMINGQSHHLGNFDREEDAAKAAQEGRARLMSHAHD